MGEFGVPSREEEAAREAVPRQDRRVDSEALTGERVLRALHAEQPSQEYVLAIVFVDAGFETAQVKRCLAVLQDEGAVRYVPFEGWVSSVTSDDDPQPMTPQAEQRFFRGAGGR